MLSYRREFNKGHRHFEQAHAPVAQMRETALNLPFPLANDDQPRSAGIGESQLVNVNDLLENAVNVAALSFSIVVERCYAELPPVRCDVQQLKQVFLNLLLNALQAVGDFGVIRLVTEAQGDFVQIRVEDNGCGIPEKQIEQIFDPFFTTRRTGTAAGLGLAHCYQIVRHHGGEITVQSKVGVGSTFLIRLPV